MPPRQNQHSRRLRRETPMGFSLSGMIAGAGKGAADVGEKLVGVEATRLATLDIDKERAAVQALRDERLMAHTTTERVAGEGFKAGESALDRSQKDRHHKDTIERVDRTTIKDLHSNLVKEKQQLLTAITADPSDAQSRARLAEVNKDIVDVTSLAKSKLGSGAKADPKAGKGDGAKRDWSAFAPGAKSAVSTAETAVAPAEPAKAEAPTVDASAEPATGALNEIAAPDKSPFERAASSVGGIINSARAAGYKPGVSKEAGESQDMRPGMTLNVGGKRLTVMNYLKDSKNGAVWRVKDESGKMYEYVAPLE